MIKIAVDAMGGDNGPVPIIKACAQMLTEDPDLAITLVGDQDTIHTLMKADRRARTSTERLCVQHCTDFIRMNDPPMRAMRKKNSSMRVALNMVKAGKAQACVSAGNSGALMALSRYVSGTWEGVDRPALLTSMPTHGGSCYMLDLGANVECEAHHLYQFAIMGSALCTAVKHIKHPRIGLLNVGSEEMKGLPSIRGAAQLIQSSQQLNYIGFIEGHDVHHDRADVIVCDGFAGNIALKTSEGLAKLINEFLREEFSRNIYSRLAALIAWPVLRAMRRRVDPRRYNGATLLGLNHIVVKSHGHSDAIAFMSALQLAIAEARANIPQRIGDLISLSDINIQSPYPLSSANPGA